MFQVLYRPKKRIAACAHANPKVLGLIIDVSWGHQKSFASGCHTKNPRILAITHPGKGDCSTSRSNPSKHGFVFMHKVCKHSKVSTRDFLSSPDDRPSVVHGDLGEKLPQSATANCRKRSRVPVTLAFLGVALDYPANS